jgi:hypothetical protein
MRTVNIPLAAIATTSALMVGAIGVLAHRIGGMSAELHDYRKSREYCHGLVVGFGYRGNDDSQ